MKFAKIALLAVFAVFACGCALEPTPAEHAAYESYRSKVRPAQKGWSPGPLSEHQWFDTYGKGHLVWDPWGYVDVELIEDPSAPSSISGLNRDPSGGGSFTLRTYQADSLGNVQQLAPVPQFQQAFMAGQPPRQIKTPPGWSFLGDKLLGAESRKSVAGDLLGTGVPVSITAGLFSTSDSQVMVMVGTPNFDISSSAPFSNGSASAPASLLAADLNGDGRADVVTFNGPDITVLLMNADGSLGPPAKPAMPPPGLGFFSGTAYDFNHDGNIDLAIVNSASGQNSTVTILLGKGDGTFKPPIAFSTCGAAGVRVQAVAAGDLNGDGKPDLAVACGEPNGRDGEVAVHFGNGDGTFQAAQSVSTGGEEVDHIAIADMNGDGKPDIVAVDANTLRLLLVFLNSGNGTFSTVSRYSIADENDQFFLADFDWDGNLDVVFAQGHPDLLAPEISFPGISVFFGNGDGTLRAPRAAILQGPPSTVVTGDFNGDGKQDTAVTTGGIGQTSTMQVFLSSGNGGLTSLPPITDSSATSWNLYAAADFNRDGILDLAALRIGTNGQATVVIYAGKGDGTFPTSTSTAASSSANGVAVGDLNGDQIPDVVVSNGSLNTVSILLGKGDGTFQPATTVAAGSNPMSPRLIDLNGDGKLDLVVVNPGTTGSNPTPGGISVLLGNGNGAFQTAAAYAAGANPFTIAMADLNGDGKPDFVTATAGGQLNVALNLGDGSFAAPAAITTEFFPQQIAIADVTGDGIPDLLVAHCCGATDLTVAVGHGDGAFDSEIALPVGQSFYTVNTADLTGAGLPDIVYTEGPTNFGVLAAALILPSPSATKISTPAPGTTLSSNSATFTWAAVPGATNYRLDIGSTSGGNDIFSQVTTGTSLTVNNLPTGGQTLYVSVSAFFNGFYQPPNTFTYTAATGGVQRVPSAGSVQPASGNGTAAQTFIYQFSDPAGWQSLSVVNVLINNFLDGRHACYLAYVVSNSTLVLVDDLGDAGGPYAGSVTAGNPATAIQNSQCAVSLASASGSGATLTLTLSIAFKAGFAGNRIQYLAARDTAQNSTDWQALGVWQVPPVSAGTIVVSGASPARGAAAGGAAQTFVLSLTDSQGAGDIGIVNLLVNNFIDGRKACYLAYVASSNSVLLVDDGGDAGGPFAGSLPLTGGTAKIQNGQCTVSAVGSSAAAAGNTLTLTLNLTFQAGFTGNRILFVAGRDNAGGNNTDWQAAGTWTVQ